MNSFWVNYFIGFILCYIGWVVGCYWDENIANKIDMDGNTIWCGGFWVSILSWVGVAIWCYLFFDSFCKLLSNRYKAVFSNEKYKFLTAQEAYNIAMKFKPYKDRNEEYKAKKATYKILKKVNQAAKHGECVVYFDYHFSDRVTKKLTDMGYDVCKYLDGDSVKFNVKEINKKIIINDRTILDNT